MAIKAILAGSAITYMYDTTTNELITIGNTNIDTSLNMSVTVEEGRGGQGNALVGQYFHTSTFGVTITDQLFSMDYLRLNTGGILTQGSDVLTSEQFTVIVDGEISVTETPQLFGTKQERTCWYKLANEDDSAFRMTTLNETTKTGVASDVNVGDVVCIRYVKNSASALKFLVEANYVPSTVRLVMVAGLYKSGVTKAKLSSSSKLGDFIVDIPNFQLEGTNELALSSTSMAQSSLSGKALVTFGGGNTCSDGGYYATITQDINGADEFAEVENLIVSGGADIELATGAEKTLIVKKVFKKAVTPSAVDNDKLTFVSKDEGVATVSGGKVTAVGVGTTIIEIKVTSRPEISGYAEIEVK